MTTTKPICLGLYSPNMQSGKSTLANILRSNHGFEVLRFAGPLKSMFKALLESLGVPEEDQRRMIEGDLKETPSSLLYGHTPRYIMQTLGTEWGRDLIGKHFWARAAATKAGFLMDQGKSVVFDDMRFANEVEACLTIGGHPVQIIRRAASLQGQSHPSEGGLNSYTGWHHTIHNNSSVDDLMFEAEKLVASFR